MKKIIAIRKEFLSFPLFLPVICSLLLLFFTVFYFRAYAAPYMQKNIINISDGWQYRRGDDGQLKSMRVLKHIDMPAGETLILTRILKERVTDAYLMLKSDHQKITIRLDGKLIFESPYFTGTKNPGMALHFAALPAGYTGKLLQIELISPYEIYSGAPGSIYLGDITSLEAYALSRSMQHTLLMVLCLAAGGVILVLAVWRRKQKGIDWGNFYFGIFSILWGFYFPSSDYTVHQFFDPQWVSFISIGLYFLYPLPLMLYFYYQFLYCRRAFLPAVILRGVFAVAAYALQISGWIDFADMLKVNNPLYVISVIYMIGLGVIELKRGNRFLKFSLPWILLAFFLSFKSLVSFYTSRIRQDETLYEMAVFMLIMVVWVYNIREFFRIRAQERNDNQVLRLKNELVLQSYENSVKHLEQVSLLRHEMKNHIAAMQILIEGREYEKVQHYLSGLNKKQEQVQQAKYCGHYLLNAILSTRLGRLAQGGVRVTKNIAVYKELRIPDEDLSSLILNILDNAWEALTMMQPDDDKWLELKILEKKPYLYIYCKNAKKGEVVERGEDFITAKQDKENHGHGIRIIKQIIKKYDGLLNISYTADTFTVEAAVKLETD